MKFFSYERILRGVLSWRQASLLAVLISTVCAAFLLSLSQSYSLSIHMSIGIFTLIPLVVAALVDSVCHILPDPLLLFSVIIALVALAFSPWNDIGKAILSAGVFLVIGLGMNRISSFGRGDAKLMGVLGLWLGSPFAVCVALLCAFTGAALFASTLLVVKRAKLHSSIALGPWLIGGASLSWCALYVV